MAKKSAFGSFATSSALTSAANSSIGRALGCFSVSLRTHPSKTLVCIYQYLLAILNFPQLRMAVWSERHVMQLDKRLLKIACTLLLIVSSRSAGPQKILNGKYVFFLSSEHGLSLSVVAAVMISYFRLIAQKSKPRTLVIRHHRSLCR